jgi:hypothetical protein
MRKKVYFRNECLHYSNCPVELPRKIQSASKSLEEKCRKKKMSLETGISILKAVAKDCQGSIRVKEPNISFN